MLTKLIITQQKRKYVMHPKRFEIHTTDGSHTIGMLCKHTNNGMLCIPVYGMYRY